MGRFNKSPRIVLQLIFLFRETWSTGILGTVRHFVYCMLIYWEIVVPRRDEGVGVARPLLSLKYPDFSIC